MGKQKGKEPEEYMRYMQERANAERNALMRKQRLQSQERIAGRRSQRRG